MQSRICRFVLLLSLLSGCASSHPIETKISEKVVETDDSEVKACLPKHSALHIAVLYIPNRIFDLLDIIRLRIRVGPGIGVSARATKLLQVYLGSYISIYCGLPGPRQTPKIPWPVGFESYNGVAISLLDATADAGIGPRYSDSEFGLGLQLAVIGFDLGIDPVEVIDFITGLVTLSVRDDDL